MTTGTLSRRAMLLGAGAACVLPQRLPGQSRELEGGIGGTGIVGLLTDFGSLIVAGQYVETDAATVFTDAFGPLRKENLAVGDSLTIEAAQSGGRLVARRVHLTHPLVGTITQLAGETAIVNATEVVLPGTRPALQVGQRVAVSGLWRGRAVRASRITAARSSFDVMSGDLRRTGQGSFIGNVATRSARLLRQPDGSFATVIGTFDAATQRITAQTVRTGRFFESAGPLRRLAVEGYLEPAPRAPGFRVSGLGHSFARNLDLSGFATGRTLFTGPYTGLFAANQAFDLPEDTAARRALLRGLATRG